MPNNRRNRVQTKSINVRCPDPDCGQIVAKTKFKQHLTSNPKHRGQNCPKCYGWKFKENGTPPCTCAREE